jgi:hypothetical protein
MKLVKLSFIFLFLLTAIAHSEKIIERYDYSGQINKFINYKTNIMLPGGNWTATGIAKEATGARWMGVLFSLFEDDKVVATILTWAPREVSSNGWNPNDNIICDDYESQGSNYHYISEKSYSKGWIKGDLACHNIYVENKVDNGYCPSCDEVQNTFQYWDNHGIETPSSLVHIGFSFLEKQNWVDMTISLNPEFAGFDDKPNIWWEQSEWHRSQIGKHPEKDDFMNNVISKSSKLRESLFKEFQRGKKGVMNLSDQRILSSLLPLSENLK